MTVRGAIATIATCTALLTFVGGSAGWAIGTFAPGFYRSVFRGGNEPWFDPVDVGVGAGVSQGIVGGVVVGVVVVAIFAWRDSRLHRHVTSAPAPSLEPDAAAGRPRDERFSRLQR